MFKRVGRYIENLLTTVRRDGLLVALRLVRAEIASRTEHHARQLLLIFRRNGCVAASRFVWASLTTDNRIDARRRPPRVAARPSTGRKLRVLCPAGEITGGPEALHQLVHVARGLGVDARIAYLPPTTDIPAPYQVYDVAPIADVHDTSDTVVVVPEGWADRLLGFRHAAPVVWWLSWDCGRANYDAFNQRDVVHACQSYYAFDMLLERLRRPEQLAMLSDFTRAEFLSGGVAPEKEDIAAVFPRKGWEFTERIMAANPDIEFVRIERMTPEQVKKTLQRAKVYIDFGRHPGKDRIPREAAVCGCCVITPSDAGASQYFEDIPIPHTYKFPTMDFSALAVGDAIRDCMVEYERRIGDFEPYRAAVRSERLVFEEQVYRLMEVMGCLGSTGS